MWRVLRWTLVVGLSCAGVAAAGQEATTPRRVETRTARVEASQPRPAGRDTEAGTTDFARALMELARLRLGQGRLDEAVPLLSRAFALSEEHLRKEALELSESGLTSLLQSLRTDEERLYTLLQASPDNARLLRLALTAALLRKGRSLEETSRIFHALSRSFDPEDREAFERLRALRAELATLSRQGPGSLAAADSAQHLAALTAQGDALEADLARRSARLSARTALPPSEEIVDRVAASLPADGALIEFIAYAARPLLSKPGTAASESPGPLRYLALVLFPDGRIRAIDLGPAAPIDSATSALGDALATRAVDYRVHAQTLYTRAFQPLRRLLGKSRRLYLAPDGPLCLVPFHALHDGHRFLIEDYDFTYLTSGRDLLPRPEALSSSDSVVVLADPEIGAPAALPASSEAMKVARAQRMVLSPALGSQSGELSERFWAPLPGTRQEARAIQRLFPQQARLFLGPEATKEQLLRLSTPSILHVATHGFFHEDTEATEGARALGLVGGFSDDSSMPFPQAPMLRSGLLLASEEARAPEPRGGTLRSQGAPITALELAGMDLWGTELVVLSACDTGLGAVELGQGVYGLRRAFLIAGAETVVTSLWQVNDDTTRLLMESYYRHLRAGEGRSEALRAAMLTVRGTYEHPYYWAPFISLGRDAPLRSLGSLASRSPAR